jgi:hypothetical protein
MSTNKPASLRLIHKILLLFVATNVIGDIGNVMFWWAINSSRLSLTLSIIGNVSVADNALNTGTIVLFVVAVIYIVSLFGLIKKMLWAPRLVIAISVAN